MITRYAPPLPRAGRGRRRLLTWAVGLAFLASAGTASAQKLDKPRQAWLAGHRLLALADEVRALRRVSNPDDLAEFERIFWARRSPDPSAPVNPFRSAVEKARAEADARFGETGRRGSETACGQVFMLMGNPDETAGRSLMMTFGDRATRNGARRPETWTYKSNATRAFKMPGGDLRLQFDDGCEFDEGPRALEELSRMAALRVLHPEIAFTFAADGRLQPWVAPAPPPASSRSLLDRPVSDFPLTFEVVLQMPGSRGGYTAGILRSPPGAVTRGPAGAPGAVVLRTQASAVPATGPAIEFPEREVSAAARPDGSFLTSYGMVLPPGHYDVKVAVLESAGGKTGTTVVPLDVPDYEAGSLVVGPLMVLAGGPDQAGAAGGVDPYAAFITPTERLFPRAGNVLTASEALRLLVLVHGAAVKPETGRASLRARFSVSRDGTIVARGSEQSFGTRDATPTVGPIPLTPFGPGRYVARVEIDDDVAGTHVAREAAFEVVPPRP